MTPTQLRTAIDRSGLSQVGMARAIGIDPRTIRRYLSGALPVPKWLPLALRGLTAPQRPLAPPQNAVEGHDGGDGHG